MNESLECVLHIGDFVVFKKGGGEETGIYVVQSIQDMGDFGRCRVRRIGSHMVVSTKNYRFKPHPCISVDKKNITRV